MSDGTLNLTVPAARRASGTNPASASTLSTSDQERWMAAACGTALAMFGARRGGFGGGLLATPARRLSVRAAMGRRDYGYRPGLDRSTAERARLARVRTSSGSVRGIVPGKRPAVVDADAELEAQTAGVENRTMSSWTSSFLATF